MNKNRIRLNESQLHKVIKESVKKVLRESYGTDTKYEFETKLTPNDEVVGRDIEIRYGKWRRPDGSDSGVQYWNTPNGKEYYYEDDEQENLHQEILTKGAAGEDYRRREGGYFNW